MEKSNPERQFNNSRGQIIDQLGEKINVTYKYIKDLEAGTFKSDDGNHVYMFKYGMNKLAHIDTNDDEENINFRDNQKELEKMKEIESEDES